MINPQNVSEGRSEDLPLSAMEVVIVSAGLIDVKWRTHSVVVGSSPRGELSARRVSSVS